MVGEACLPSNAYYPRTPDYTLYSGVMSVGLNIPIRHSFMDLCLDYGLGTMTTTTLSILINLLSPIICAKIRPKGLLGSCEGDF